MKTLIYLGCHEGFSLKNLLNNYQFDKILLIEADPDTFKKLIKWTSNIPNIITLNKCVVSDPKIQKVKLFRTINDGASNSILKPEVGSHFIKDEIEIDAVYLPNILKEYNIDNIDFYISDIQGNDLNVLLTIKEFLIDKKIKELFLETFNENYNFYEKNNNKFKDYYNLLKDNYKIDYYSADSTILNTPELVTKFLMNDGSGELDIHWSLKEQQSFNYMAI